MTTNFNLDEILNKVERDLKDRTEEPEEIDVSNSKSVDLIGVSPSDKSTYKTGGHGNISHTGSYMNKQINMQINSIPIGTKIRCISNGTPIKGNLISRGSKIIVIERYNIFKKTKEEIPINIDEIKEFNIETIGGNEYKKTALSDGILNQIAKENAIYSSDTSSINTSPISTSSINTSPISTSSTTGITEEKYDLLFAEISRKMLHYSTLENRIAENEKNLEKLFTELKKVYSMVKNLYKALVENQVITLEN